MCCSTLAISPNTTCKPLLTCCQKRTYMREPVAADNDADERSTSWEELLPDLDTDEGEPFDPLPEVGEPPSWADLDEWDIDDD